ncbi:YceI family protein [Pedobacter sp. Du54]|uniref:YceI family protein n=1 Tax=Pedobacter anseongensis TaxID=3133439 RepID=UPI0030967BD3
MINYIILVILTFTLTNFSTPKSATKWVITQNSSLTIHGSTNVNTFSCAILNYPKTDTITINRTNDLMLLTGALSLNVNNFECNNLMMTHQFRKTLKHEEFPFLYITFLSLKEFPTPNQRVNSIKGLVAIKIAGVTKRFEICYEFESVNNYIQLRGHQTVNFSDFKLVAPQRVGKLIKAKDELKVVFELKMKMVD